MKLLLADIRGRKGPKFADRPTNTMCRPNESPQTPIISLPFYGNTFGRNWSLNRSTRKRSPIGIKVKVVRGVVYYVTARL